MARFETFDKMVLAIGLFITFKNLLSNKFRGSCYHSQNFYTRFVTRFFEVLNIEISAYWKSEKIIEKYLTEFVTKMGQKYFFHFVVPVWEHQPWRAGFPYLLLFPVWFLVIFHKG